jgi:3-hydroxyisobutyrate dehydrogenase-like beta-hydroxyacid dehydrogenase
MSSIAFLGLGMMGDPMARRLIDAGNDVTVWDRSPSHTEPFARLAATAGSPAGAIVGAEFVITMLATPQALESVLFGVDGVSSSITDGQTWIDMSTVGPAEFTAAMSRLPTGVAPADAPVRGSVPEANAGRLHIFVGSADELFPRVKSLLTPLGDVRHAGGPGSGAAMKLVVNLALVAAMVTFGESLALANAFALDRDVVMDVLAESPIGGIVTAKRANVEAGQYPASFKLELATKDMALVEEAAHAAGLSLAEATAVHHWMELARSEGAGPLDFSAVAATILEHAAATQTS